jgi:hypothetical protein
VGRTQTIKKPFVLADRRWQRTLACLIAAGFAAASWSRPAEASPDFHGDSAPSVSFDLKGSGGYGANVYGAGREVLLEIHGHHQQALYTVRGRASTRGIWARFGNRGRISVRFNPTAQVRRALPPDRCKGKPRFTQFGIFAGMIRFVGEQRYVEINAERVRGRIDSWTPWRCKAHRRYSMRPSERPTQLEAQSQDGRLTFSASWAPGYEEGVETITLFAGSSERIDHVDVSRVALVFPSRRVFTFDEALTTASVGSAGPFDGRADFQRMADGSTIWDGSLSVDLPGARNVRLTGPQFDVRLFHECEYLFCRMAQQE